MNSSMQEAGSEGTRMSRIEYDQNSKSARSKSSQVNTLCTSIVYCLLVSRRKSPLVCSGEVQYGTVQKPDRKVSQSIVTVQPIPHWIASFKPSSSSNNVHVPT